MELYQMVERQTAYTLEVYRQILPSKSGNVAVSPLSIAAALAMAAVGAKGETLNQLVSHLKHPDSEAMHQFSLYMKNMVLKDSSQEGGPLLEFANCVLVDKALPLHRQYQELVRENYGAEAAAVDFQCQAEWIRVQVNLWVNHKTRGKIFELFPPGTVTQDTQCLLANALYFKGQWDKQFDPAMTRNETFYLLDGTSVTRPMMTTRDKQYIKNCGTFKVLRLPYRQNVNGLQSFSMYILLPNLRNGLSELESHLDGTAATWFMEQLPSVNEAVPVGRFLLPPFSISTDVEASKFLFTLGLQLPFDEMKADFTGMLDEAPYNIPPLFISKVFHKATVEVNEEGTVASAATGISVAFGRALQPQNTEDFVADHPFLFLIRADITGVVLFIGRVMNPE